MIVYCCHDLIFATKIHSTAEALGLVCRPARDPAALLTRLNCVDDGKAHGEVRAVFVDLTMGEAGLKLIELAKGHESCPHVVAFAPHVEVQSLRAAEQLGADRVMPRGAFTAQLPQLLQACSTAKQPLPGSDDTNAH